MATGGGSVALALDHPQVVGGELQVVFRAVGHAGVVHLECGVILALDLAPSGETLPHEVADGLTWVTVPRVEGHQVVVFAE